MIQHKMRIQRLFRPEKQTESLPQKKISSLKKRGSFKTISGQGRNNNSLDPTQARQTVSYTSVCEGQASKFGTPLPFGGLMLNIISIFFFMSGILYMLFPYITGIDGTFTIGHYLVMGGCVNIMASLCLRIYDRLDVCFYWIFLLALLLHGVVAQTTDPYFFNGEMLVLVSLCTVPWLFFAKEAKNHLLWWVVFFAGSFFYLTKMGVDIIWR